MPFTCPECGRTSHHPKDEEYGYCGACGDFTGLNERRMGLLPHLQVSELRVLQDALTAFSAAPELGHRARIVTSLQTAVAEAIIHAFPKEPV